VGFVVHELLHRMYTDFNARGGVQYVQQLHNAIEDAWIERKGIAANLTGNIEGLLTTLVNGMVDEAMDAVTDWTDQRQYPFVLAVYARAFCKRVPMAQGLETIFAEAESRIPACQSSTDTLAVAVWVYEQLQALPDQQGDKPQDGEDGQDGQDGQDKGQDKGQDGGQDDGQDGPSEPSDGSENGEQGSGDGDGAGEEKKAGKARPVDANQEAVEVEPNLKGEGSESGASYSKRYSIGEVGVHVKDVTPRDLTVSVPAKMRYEVKRLFENSATEDFQTNRRAGSLNVRSLHKVATSDRLFKRRLESEGIDSAVVIMLDVSGSMFAPVVVRDERGYSVRDYKGDATYKPAYINDALKTCAAMLDTLNRAGVKTMVITFGAQASILKPWAMPLPRALEQMSKVGSGVDTNDYAALRFAHEMLHGRSESRKVVFVITDGQGQTTDVRAQCGSGVALGITTIGVGIALDVSESYPVSVTVEDAANLGKVAFKQIKLAA
jgi:Mg-chelatase subunit ChlD